jgi:hypothetical protein
MRTTLSICDERKRERNGIPLLTQVAGAESVTLESVMHLRDA